MIMSKKAPKNFPFTICQTESGLVSNNSIVPCFLSSEKLRIVTAGIKKIKTQGANVKNGVKSAKELSKMLKSPGKTHKKSPFKSKKTPITKYPISDPKKDCISLNNIDFIYV